MPSRKQRIVALSDAFATPPFFGDPVVSISRFLATSLLHIARVPHKYALCHTALGSSPALQVFRNAPDFGPIARADGCDPSSAVASMTRCLFELLERVWSPHVNIASLPYKSRAELGDAAMDPRRFVLLADEEYDATNRFVRYADALRLHWEECWRLSPTGMLARSLVPAVFIYPGFGIRCPDERLVPMLSTGIAAGARYDEAILNGLCEVVERDAFALAWLRLGSPPRVSIETPCLGPGARTAIDDLTGDHFEVRLFDLTRDIHIPVAMAAITDRRKGEPAKTVLGLGCSPWPAQALEKALGEALQQMTNHYEFPGGLNIVRKAAALPVMPEEDAARQAALSRFLAGDTESSRFAQPFAAPDRARTPEMLVRCLGELEKRGFHALFCDLTPQEVGDADQFCLVRVLIPDLQPHVYERDCWRLAGSRLFDDAQPDGAKEPAGLRVNKVVNPLAWDVIR